MSIRVMTYTEPGNRAEARYGVLTTEHAASSYGLPVVVVDGIAYGSAEVYGGLTMTHDEDLPLADEMITQAEAAGYRLHRIPTL